MELQFDKSVYKSLHKILSHVFEQELTQEIRLPESLPDIGRVLGSWGQVILRSKEWYGNNIGVSGGVMAWILYMPEDDTQARSVETWIPFQMKWDIPDAQRDGSILVLPFIKSVDSRTISARKFMLRTNISIQCEAYEPKDTTIYHADQLPEDIQVLKQTYPLHIPTEAGEKPFQIDDAFMQPANAPKIEKVCHCDVNPQVTETKILGDKLLFRGKVNLHGLYFGSDGSLQSLDQELLFSQYTHLDSEYSSNASAWTYPVITGIELDLTAEQPTVKMNLSVQYMIYETKMMEITEDVYSISREIKPEIQSLQIPSRLDTLEKNIELSQKLSIHAKEILDFVWYPAHPEKQINGLKMEIEQTGAFELLYLDMDGNMQGCTVPAKQTWEMLSDSQNSIEVYGVNDPRPRIIGSGEDASITIGTVLHAVVTSENGLPMTSSIEIGEQKELDPMRPSLIVRKIGKSRIWDVAKQYGAKVTDIQQANGIYEEPKENQVLLIPVS